MQIKLHSGGFVELLDNPRVTKITVQYCKDSESESNCIVTFRDGKTFILRIMCSSYNAQYGLPVSNDGTVIIAGTWERGIFAYDIITGMLLWRYPKGKARTMIISNEDLIVARANSSVFRLNIHSGQKSDLEIKSGTIENIFPLSNKQFFLKYYRGNCCVVNCKDFSIEHIFSKSEINPHNCLSLLINKVEIDNKNNVLIKGFEDYPNGLFNTNSIVGKKYSRALKSYKIKEDG